MLSREDILKADDRKTVEVEIPEWGGTVLLMEMSAKERDDYEVSLQTFDANGKASFNPENVRAKLVSACLVDENGQRMFTVNDLAQKNGRVIDRLFQAASELNSVAESAIEDAAKN